MTSYLLEMMLSGQSTAGMLVESTDYWHLLCGLTMTVFAVLCSFMSHRVRELPAWRWLAAFGILQGTHQWMEMLPAGLGDSGGFAVFRLVLLACSAFALAESGRRGMAKLGVGGKSRWILIAILLLAASGATLGLGGLNLTVHLVLAMGGGIWAALALFLASRSTAYAGGALRLVGGSLAAYALTLGALTSAGLPLTNGPVDTLPAAFLPYLNPLRVLLSIVLAVSLWHYLRCTQRQRDARTGMALGRRFDRWLGPALLTTALLGGAATEITGNFRDREMRSILLSRTSLSAAALNPDRIKGLTGSEADVENPDYKIVKQRLMAMRATGSDCRFIYLVALRGNDVVILVDSEPSSSEDYSPPGQVYAEASEILRSSLSKGQSLLEGPLPDRWGVWVSSFVPIFDSQTHRLLAVIGQDTDARDWNRSIYFHRLATICVTLLISLLVIVFFVIQQRSYESARAIGLSERRYRQMFEKNPALMFLIHPDSGVIIDANPAACAYYGYSAAELHEKPLWHLDAGSREQLEEALGKALSGSDRSFGRRHKIRSGEIREVEIRPGPVETPEGTVLYCVVHDVTERTRAEENLRQAKDSAEMLNGQLEEAIAQANRLAVDAEVASQAKGRFLATMSHEIRTPLNGLIGLTGLLIDSGLTESQQRLAEMMRTSGDALLSVINDVLDYSKIDAGKIELEKIEFDPTTPVMDTLKILGARAADKGLVFAADMAPDLPAHVLGDPGSLRRILLNLASNAIKFTGEGSVIIHGKVDAEDTRQITLRFDVTDTGIGMPPHRIDRLFQPFSQLDSSTTRKYGGTGLGLVISKRLSEIMGGAIGVESESGKGTTFWFTAVFEKSAVAFESVPAVIQKTEYASPRNLRILVVDDDEINRIVARGIIENALCHAVCVGSAQEAIETLETQVFDVVLMDVQMPEMDGFDAAAAIRRRETASQRQRTPIIALTAHVGKAEADRSRRVGIDGCLSKPVDPDALLEAIGKVLTLTSPAESAPSESECGIPDAALDVFNPAELLDRVGGSTATFDKLIAMFRASAPKQIAAMQSALADGNLGQVRQEAHSLRGAAANMSAANTASAARRIEDAAVNGDAVSIGPLLELLNQEWERLQRELSSQAIAAPPVHRIERTEPCAY